VTIRPYIEPQFVSKACGKLGADVGPDWQMESQFPALATM